MNLFEEETDTVDIPDFVEDKDSTDSSSVDMSIFKMSDDELYDDVPKRHKNKKVVNDDSDDAPAPKKKSNATLILCLILIGVLLVTTVVSMIYAFKEHGKVETLNTQVFQLSSQNGELQGKVDELNNQIAELNKKIEEQGNAGTKSDPNNKYPKGTVLYITEDGQGMGVKKEANVKSDFVNDKILDWGDKVTLIADATVDNDGNYWGKVENGFIRIEYDGEIWATTDPQ